MTVRFSGNVRQDRRTKRLCKRLQAGDIALIAHDDLDAVAAQALVECRVRAVLNCRKSLTGKYINRGPHILLEADIPLVDNIGDDIMDILNEGDAIEVRDGEILRGDVRVGTGAVQTADTLDRGIAEARKNLDALVRSFAENTLDYMGRETHLLTENLDVKKMDLDFSNRHVLVVARGLEYKRDLEMLRQYIRDRRPVLIAVDGGADALLEFGFRPDIILGDMDSVTDAALGGGATLIVHGYRGGRAPGMVRIEKLGLKGHVISGTGTSEDLALLLAFEHNAELIVIVGSHFSVEDFLSKDRPGMASTFLTRLKVGSILVDAKGVSKLTRNPFRPVMLLYIVLAALFPALVLLFVSPIGSLLGQFFRLYRLLFQN